MIHTKKVRDALGLQGVLPDESIEFMARTPEGQEALQKLDELADLLVAVPRAPRHHEG